MVTEKKKSALQQIREARGLTRRELAEKSGVNYRSLQDYEQGHKEIASAKGDTLYRLSLALGCTIENILELGSLDNGLSQRIRSYCELMLVERLEEKTFFSEEYQTYVRVKMNAEGCALVFCYRGEMVQLPFTARVTKETLPWMEDVIVMTVNSYLRSRTFADKFTVEGGKLWNEF